MQCLALLKSEGAALLFQSTGYLFHQVILGRLELGNWYFKIACSSNIHFYYGDNTGGHLYRSIKVVNKCLLKSRDCRFCFYVQIFQLDTYMSLSQWEKPHKYCNRLSEKMCSRFLRYIYWLFFLIEWASGSEQNWGRVHAVWVLYTGFSFNISLGMTASIIKNNPVNLAKLTPFNVNLCLFPLNVQYKPWDLRYSLLVLSLIYTDLFGNRTSVK